MRKSTISKSKRLEVLAQWDVGASIDELFHTHQVSVATLYNWGKSKLEDEDETKRQLKVLAAEKDRLKKMYTRSVKVEVPPIRL